MATYKTPGVYVEEISTLPASVAQVETAIPAFIGYTQKAMKKGESLIKKPTRIKSMLDFETYFGKAPAPEEINVSLDAGNDVASVEIKPKFYLHSSMKMFYSNGGGPCYIIAVDTYKDTDGNDNTISKDKLLEGITVLNKEDEPTLILTPDAPLLPSAQDMADVQTSALKQCNDLQDRFCIFDIYGGEQERSYDKDTDVIIQFRNKIGSKFLKYGAAYYPWIKTSLGYNFKYKDVTLKKNGSIVSLASVSKDDAEVTKLDNVLEDLKLRIKTLTGANHGTGNAMTYTQVFEEVKATPKATIKNWADTIKSIATEITKLSEKGGNEVQNKELLDLIKDKVNLESKLHNLVQTLSKYDYGYESAPGATARLGSITENASNEITDFNGSGTYVGIENYGLKKADVDSTIYGSESGGANHLSASASAFRTLFEDTLSILLSIESEAEKIAETQEQTVIETNPVYSNVVNKVKEQAVILPPSGSVAGVYASVDRNRGVWKAPANISLTSTISPTVQIDKKDQEDLNADVIAGKSVNAIRSFIGKGTLIWGARTLAGNDNEWRYINVRRFYNMVEESLKKATENVVFESNDANTWVKLKAQIENYLTLLWRDGALAGAVPEHAFFVNIGLGKTMTAQDILEGRLIIEIGMAVVRPAEFIILKFSHKMQES